MARILIRRNKLNTEGSSLNPDSSISGSTGSESTTVFTPQPITGEPDSDDTDPTGNNHVSDSGADGNGTRFVDPASAGGDTGDSPKRRGRPRGSRNGTTKRTTATQTSTDLNKILLTVHYGLSKMMGSEIWMLAEEESKEMADAVTRVTQLYDIQIIPERQMAWINLGLVGLSIYGPRVMASRKTKSPKPTLQNPQVITMHPPIATGDSVAR